jgi:hypothetical protein
MRTTMKTFVAFQRDILLDFAYSATSFKHTDVLFNPQRLTLKITVEVTG